MKNPITVRIWRAVKTLVIVTLSESFRIRPRLPFQVNLGFAKPTARLVLQFPSTADFRLGYLEGIINYPLPIWDDSASEHSKLCF